MIAHCWLGGPECLVERHILPSGRNNHPRKSIFVSFFDKENNYNLSLFYPEIYLLLVGQTVQVGCFMSSGENKLNTTHFRTILICRKSIIV